VAVVEKLNILKAGSIQAKLPGSGSKISWGQNWIATGPDGLVPFHSQKEFSSRSFKMADVGSLLLLLELGDDFDFINDIVRAVSWVEI